MKENWQMATTWWTQSVKKNSWIAWRHHWHQQNFSEIEASVSDEFKPAALDKWIHERVCWKRKRKKLGKLQQHDEVNQLKRTVELLDGIDDINKTFLRWRPVSVNNSNLQLLTNQSTNLCVASANERNLAHGNNMMKSISEKEQLNCLNMQLFIQLSPRHMLEQVQPRARGPRHDTSAKPCNQNKRVTWHKLALERATV